MQSLSPVVVLCNGEYSANVSNLRSAQGLLVEIARLERAGRRPRTAVWFPLLVFGLIDLPGAVFALTVGREHLAAYFVPANTLGGLLCAWYYYRTGKTRGLQTPIFAWLVMILAASVIAAACSASGRALGWDLLNLAGPFVATAAGLAVLALWARSTTLLAVVTGIALTTVLVLSRARGDAAIALQLVGIAGTMLLMAGINRWSEARTP